MPRYWLDARWVKLEDLTLNQAHVLFHKYDYIAGHTQSSKQWARALIARDEIVREVINNPARGKPKNANGRII